MIHMIACLICIGLLAQPRSYGHKKEMDLSIASIPENLKQNARSVMRQKKVQIKIRPGGKAVIRTYMAVSVLNRAHSDFAYMGLIYNKQIDIHSLNGELLDASGKSIKKLKQKDIQDQAYNSSYEFHSDNRQKAYEFNISTYPATIIYEHEYSVQSLFFLSNIYALDEPFHHAVQSFEVELIVPEEEIIRHRWIAAGQPYEESETRRDGNIVYKWSMENLPAISSQSYASAAHFVPRLELSAVQMNLYQYKARVNNWGDFGSFIFKMHQGRDSLPKDQIELAQKLTEGLPTLKDKVQALYGHLQKNCRYVAIPYGIAGWQPYPASKVATHGYGDCKDLTNYLKSLLAAIDVPAFAALVKAGNLYVDTLEDAFPNNKFNHEILCVPSGKDTLWVECTSSYLPAGYLGSFTQDRDVLILSQQGGFRARTPAYGKESSYIHRRIDCSLNLDAGEQSLKIRSYYSGVMQDDLRELVLLDSKDKTRKLMEKKFDFPTYHLTSFEHRLIDNNNNVPAIEEQAELSASGFVNPTSKRSFVKLHWLGNPIFIDPSETETRTLPLHLMRSFSIVDTVAFRLPEGSEVESLPRPFESKNDMAKYNASIVKEGDTLFYIRKYEQNKGAFAVEDYERFKKMHQAIAEHLSNSIIVIYRKQS